MSMDIIQQIVTVLTFGLVSPKEQHGSSLIYQAMQVVTFLWGVYQDFRFKQAARQLEIRAEELNKTNAELRVKVGEAAGSFQEIHLNEVRLRRDNRRVNVQLIKSTTKNDLLKEKLKISTEENELLEKKLKRSTLENEQLKEELRELRKMMMDIAKVKIRNRDLVTENTKLRSQNSDLKDKSDLHDLQLIPADDQKALVEALRKNGQVMRTLAISRMLEKDLVWLCHQKKTAKAEVEAKVMANMRKTEESAAQSSVKVTTEDKETSGQQRATQADGEQEQDTHKYKMVLKPVTPGFMTMQERLDETDL